MNTLIPSAFNRNRGSWEPLVLNEQINQAGGKLLVFTWNVNGLWERAEGRLPPCLELLKLNLKKLAREVKEKQPRGVVCIQEFSGSILHCLFERAWVRDEWNVIHPVDSHSKTYDIITLVSKNVHIAGAQMLPFIHTTMGRRAIFVDLPFSVKGEEQLRLVRIGNTHLESYDDAGTRRQQMETIATHLLSDDLHCSILAGDMNAHAPADELIPEECGLTDVWKMGVGVGDGITWGFTQKRFPKGRFDKVLLTHPERMPPQKAFLITSGKVPRLNDWMTDHHCLCAILDCSLQS